MVDTTTVKNKPLLAFLFRHYMDCLMQSIRSRCTPTECGQIEKQMRSFMRQFRQIYRLGNFYVRSINYKSGTPFRAIRGLVDVTVADALSMEQDGL